MKESTEIAACTGELPKALYKLAGRPLNEEAINVLTKPDCFATMVSHLAVGYSSMCGSDKKPEVVAAFFEGTRRRNWTPPTASSVPAPVRIETARPAPLNNGQNQNRNESECALVAKAKGIFGRRQQRQ